MEFAGLAGILAAFLGLVLTVYGVFYNGRATRALIEHNGRATRALIEVIREDIRAARESIQESIQAMHDDTNKRHEDTLAYLKEMDRRHTELIAALARRS